jgi:hypothetical protein
MPSAETRKAFAVMKYEVCWLTTALPLIHNLATYSGWTQCSLGSMVFGMQVHRLLVYFQMLDVVLRFVNHSNCANRGVPPG